MMDESSSVSAESWCPSRAQSSGSEEAERTIQPLPGPFWLFVCRMIEPQTPRMSSDHERPSAFGVFQCGSSQLLVIERTFPSNPATRPDRPRISGTYPGSLEQRDRSLGACRSSSPDGEECAGIVRRSRHGRTTTSQAAIIPGRGPRETPI